MTPTARVRVRVVELDAARPVGASSMSRARNASSTGTPSRGRAMRSYHRTDHRDGADQQ